MTVGAELLDAVAAALPAAGGAGISARAVHGRIAGSDRVAVRDALRRLIESGRANVSGDDRHRKYHRAGAAPPAASGEPAAVRQRRAPRRCREDWREYALRGDGGVRLPDKDRVGTLMQGLRFGDAEAAELAREERMPEWSWRKPTSAELTRRVFGDPQPGRWRQHQRSKP